MVRPNQEIVDLEEEIVVAEVVLAVTGVAASEVVEVSVGATVVATEEVVTKWVEEVNAETTEETGLTKC